ncbi:MAG: TIGR03560 family F420-dependent LLM class oxidoreductase, partial [Acidimicrobiales bacterium]
ANAALEPMLEGYTVLGYLAALTTSVRLRLLATAVTHRHPGVLAKTVTTLDVISGGRAELALGAAWHRMEHQAFGVPFPSQAERFERLEETLQICLQTWGPDDGPFVGRHFQLGATLCSPPPISRPRPPIVVGGGGERRTLLLVARYADACNVFAPSPGVVAHKLDVLRRHCDDVGRSYAGVDKSIVYVGDALNDTDGILREISAYAGLGVDEVVVRPPGKCPEAWIESHAPTLVAGLADLGPH